jgi:hypothetical protein
LLIAGAVIVEVVRYASDYIKRITPRIEYQVSTGIPVKVDDKYFCAYELKISNSSRKKVEEVTFHVRSRNDNLKLEVISNPDGFEYNSIDKDGGIDLSFPRLKQGEAIVVKVQTENRYLFSDSLNISVSSPNDIKEKRITDIKQKNTSAFRNSLVFIWGIAFGAVISMVAILISLSQPESKTPIYEMDRRDIVISAASVVGLPHIAELYLTALDPKYFNEGDIAFSLAVASKNPEEIEKYRRLLSVTLRNGQGMAPESQANLFYSLGKLDLLLSDESSAVSDFRNAVAKSRPIVESQAKVDIKTHKFLIDKGLL